jgi:hypothetical protein
VLSEKVYCAPSLETSFSKHFKLDEMGLRLESKLKKYGEYNVYDYCIRTENYFDFLLVASYYNLSLNETTLIIQEYKRNRQMLQKKGTEFREFYLLLATTYTYLKNSKNILLDTFLTKMAEMPYPFIKKRFLETCIISNLQTNNSYKDYVRSYTLLLFDTRPEIIKQIPYELFLMAVLNPKYVQYINKKYHAYTYRVQACVAIYNLLKIKKIKFHYFSEFLKKAKTSRLFFSSIVKRGE